MSKESDSPRILSRNLVCIGSAGEQNQQIPKKWVGVSGTMKVKQ